MNPDTVYDLLEHTWPAAATRTEGPWHIREGGGGGQRVSAATAEGDVKAADIAQADIALADIALADIALAEAAMQALGQEPLFMIRHTDTALDTLLGARGYLRHDPVVVYAAPTAALAEPAPSGMSGFPIWPPLSIATQLWADAGIGPGRVAVMERVRGPKISILGRVNDRASGVAFVACHGKAAMLHALEVVPNLRRQGSANNIMRIAAAWAQDNGADQLCLAVTEANTGARALYASLGMEAVGAYHYRKKAQTKAPKQ